MCYGVLWCGVGRGLVLLLERFVGCTFGSYELCRYRVAPDCFPIVMRIVWYRIHVSRLGWGEEGFVSRAPSVRSSRFSPPDAGASRLDAATGGPYSALLRLTPKQFNKFKEITANRKKSRKVQTSLNKFIQVPDRRNKLTHPKLRETSWNMCSLYGDTLSKSAQVAIRCNMLHKDYTGLGNFQQPSRA